MSEPIRFYYQGKVREAGALSPTRTVLQHLREDLHCTGTKEGCAEGDCGACTVVIGTLKDGGLELKSVNSCIQFLPTLDGKALFTVEDLKQDNGRLHPVQQALVEYHGSQCGFCTPGFAMSLWSLYLKQEGAAQPPCRKQIDETLSGNLCRCTGYRPIIDAAQRMGELPHAAFDRAAVQAALESLQRERMFSYTHDSQTFHAPRTLDELAALRAAKPAATILSGSTDVGLWVTKQMRDLGDVIYVRQVPELLRMRTYGGILEIGAAVSLDDAYRAICEHYPQELTELWQRFASQPIRNTGTLGGSVANGSPIGDSAPWMIALGARIVLRSAEGQRTMPLQDFYLDYMKKNWQPGEFVEAVRIPLPHTGLQFRTYKLAKRYDQDISAVCAAFAMTLDKAGVARNVHIAFGGMAATSRRAPLAEAALEGQPWNEAALNAAMAALAQDYTPLSDMRASALYRMRTAQNLLRRFWLETRPEQPLPAAAINAFAYSDNYALA
ncbi:xanthine dehydrogenase small subunit [Pseudoduganella violacea]|uniref:Xanthine dehydrogenase small subunit n=1 Tax=Pseudoduganella violacea TaxID=1715466 RepID=A0A7W5B8E6_9BURK|nr:xanthine dehydrogenase small subunit [Pseudoduganella violacea]MBB3118316.1 xanthine dehydrogenase small subunit [Pseudoduganella violacea]